MKLQLVAPGQGAAWVRRGAQVFARQPLVFITLFFCFFAALFLALVLPGIGMLAAMALLPIGSLGFMIATHHAQAGGWPLPGAFAAPFRHGRQKAMSQIQLGLAYALYTLLANRLADWIDGGQLAEMYQAVAQSNSSDPAAVNQPQMMAYVLMRMGLALPATLMFWHAPALVHWGGISAAKSMFFSLVACWRNKWAFLVYLLVWCGVAMLMGAVLQFLGGSLGMPKLAAMVLLPVMLAMMSAFYVSLYFTFIDCFDLSAEAST